MRTIRSTATCRSSAALKKPRSCVGPSPSTTSSCRSRPWNATCARWWRCKNEAPTRSTTATTSASVRSIRAMKTPSPSRASCRRTSGRSSAKAAGRSVGSRSRVIRSMFTAQTGPCSNSSRRTRGCASGSWAVTLTRKHCWRGTSKPADPRSGSKACPRASAGWATASGTKPGCCSTRWSPAAKSRRRSSSGAITWIAAPSPRRTARPRACSPAPTRSRTGPS